MMITRLRPWLWLPASTSHALAPLFLKFYGFFKDYPAYSWNSFEWRGLKFANRLGLAAGMDKDASQVQEWWKLGAGFLEVGTIVPQPQGPNEGQIMARHTKQRALWNRMGFPSCGLSQFKKNISKYTKRHTPILINIGKNRETPLESAASDYVQLIEELNQSADAFVINISSPNTKGLRNLLTADYLKSFLNPIVEKRNALGKVPLLLKLSPDLTDSELEFCLLQSLELGIDGWVLTNTTLARREDLNFPIEGGVSGQPLAELSKSLLRKSLDILGDKKGDRLIISVGGVMSPEDVVERIDMGADLVEIYTALVFEGPFFFKTVAKKIG